MTNICRRRSMTTHCRWWSPSTNSIATHGTNLLVISVGSKWLKMWTNQCVWCGLILANDLTTRGSEWRHVCSHFGSPFGCPFCCHRGSHLGCPFGRHLRSHFGCPLHSHFSSPADSYFGCQIESYTGSHIGSHIGRQFANLHILSVVECEVFPEMTWFE